MIFIIAKKQYYRKNAVFWDVAPCTSCVNRRVGGTYRLHLQGRKICEWGTSVSRWLQTHTYLRPQILHKITGIGIVLSLKYFGGYISKDIYTSSILILLSVKPYKLKFICQPRNLIILVLHSKGYISSYYTDCKSLAYFLYTPWQWVQNVVQVVHETPGMYHAESYTGVTGRSFWAPALL
jgi:hypothetical protein